MAQLLKKVCLLGDFAVGKTSLVRRYVEGIFEEKYLSTIGVKIDKRTITLDRYGQPTDLTMMLWDLAGGEKFTQARANYLRASAGALLVCDLTRVDTLNTLQTYVDDLYQASPGAKLLLLANKSDLVTQYEISVEQLEAIALDLKLPYYLTSAKTGNAVETAFAHLGQLMLA